MDGGDLMAQTVSLNVGDVSGMDMNAFFRNRDLVHAAVSSLNDGFQTMRERVERTGRTIGRMVKGLEGVVSALMHVASAEKGLDAGILNLYRWSKLFDRGFSNALDLLATNALYLKNSLAAMAAPLMQAVTPAVSSVTDRFAGLFNLVNQTVARLSGASTYVAARKTADAWDSVGGRIRRASAAVRRCIAGFDQLNVLYAGGSGGASGGSGGLANMFEERRIDSGLAAFVDQMKAAFEAADWKALGSMLGEKVNAFVEGIDWSGIGKKAGFYLNGAIATAGHLLDAVQFDNIGGKIADFLNNALSEIDFSMAGTTVALFFTSAVETFAGFARRFDWQQFAVGAAEAVNGFVLKLGEKLDAVDWAEVSGRMTEGLNEFIRHTDWIELGRTLAARVNDLFTIVGTAAQRFDWSGAGKALSDGVNGFFRRIDWAGIGRWFDRTVKGVLDFALAFLKGFDAKGFARSVERALGEVDWSGIAAKLWELLTTALSKLDDLGGVGGLLGRLFGDPSQAGGGLSRLWKGLLAGKPPVLSVGVDYEPNVPGGAAYRNKGLLDWLKAVLAPGADTQSRVELIRKGWQTVQNWIVSLFMGGDVNKGVGVMRSGFTTIAAWIQAAFMGGSVLKGVGVNRSGFTTVAAWILAAFMGGSVTKGIGVARSGFTTIAAWIQAAFMGGGVTKGIGVARSGFTTIAAWLQAAFMGGGVTKGIGIARSGFTTIAAWLLSAFMGGGVTKSIGVARNGFTTIAAWIQAMFMGGGVSKGIGIARSGFTTIAAWLLSAFMGGGVTKSIGIARSGFTTIAAWLLNSFMGGGVEKGIGLERNGWTTVAWWMDDFMGGAVSQFVKLVKDGWRTVDDWASNWMSDIALNVKLNMTDAAKKTLEAVTGIKMAGGGIVTAGGAVRGFARGGVVRKGAARWWNGIPKYAAGTGRAHGTLFAAGEAGPEIVGHINGRTEILNKSQLAQAMYSAVTSGMLAALRGIEFRIPAMATGSVMPYEVSAQIAKSAADIQGTLDANNEDLIQTIISVIGQQTAAIVAALQGQRHGNVGGLNAQQIINEINRRTQMFSASPLTGV